MWCLTDISLETLKTGQNIFFCFDFSSYFFRGWGGGRRGASRFFLFTEITFKITCSKKTFNGWPIFWKCFVPTGHTGLKGLLCPLWALKSQFSDSQKSFQQVLPILCRSQFLGHQSMKFFRIQHKISKLWSIKYGLRGLFSTIFWL